MKQKSLRSQESADLNECLDPTITEMASNFCLKTVKSQPNFCQWLTRPLAPPLSQTMSLQGTRPAVTKSNSPYIKSP